MRNTTFESMGTVVSISYSENSSPEERQRLTDGVFEIFDRFDKEFSTYRDDSFIAKVNSKPFAPLEISDDAMKMFYLAEQYRVRTEGNFDIINPQGETDPSGIVKAYAIKEAGAYLDVAGLEDWCINAGGDILVSNKTKGLNAGIVNPFDQKELISDVCLQSPFISLATSGYSERGDHFWYPKGGSSDVLQASVISDDIIFSDVMATAIISGGSQVLIWVEEQENAEALLILKNGDFLVTDSYLTLIPR